MSEITRKPGIYPVYKKSAAAQIGLINPTFNDQGWLEKEGAIFIEVAPAIGKDSNDNTTYGWKDKTKKISFSLSPNDITLLFNDFEKSIVHEYQGKIKTLTMKQGDQDKYPGSYMMTVQVVDSEKNKHFVTVPFTAGEIRYFSKLLETAAWKILGW